MPPLPDPGSLDAKVSQALAKHQTTRRTTKRLAWTFAATVAFGLTLLVAPSVSAYAAIRKMAGALDDVDRVRITDYTVGADGQRTVSRTTSYNQGAWRFDEPGLKQSAIYIGGRSYRYDGFTNAFVVEENPEGPFTQTSLKLSSIVAQANLGVLAKQIEIRRNVEFRGGLYSLATIANPHLDERQSFYTDSDTDLPAFVLTEGKEGGRWVLKAETVLDYSPQFGHSEFKPEITGRRVLSQESWLDEVATSLTAKNLGQTSLQKGRLIVRDLFIDNDGTVFVAYQAQDRNPNQWRGYGTSLEDDSGTVYARTEILGHGGGGDLIGRLKDGKLELEALVPIEPLARLKGNVTITAQLDSKNRLVRMIHTVSVHNGVETHAMSPNFWTTDTDLHTVSLGVFNKEEHAESSLQALLPMINGSLFCNAVAKDLYKARVRSRFYMEHGDKVNARKWLQESLRLIDEHERRGYGPHSKQDVLDKLNLLDSGQP